jgi:hypothetical protein
MAIPEAQLETWSHVGGTRQISDTYNTIKNALEEKYSPYWAKTSFDVYLQGSYNNDTNVYRDSDVDIVIAHKPFFHDMSRLGPYERMAATNSLPADASFSYAEFKVDVLSWLNTRFGSAFVEPGKKAVLVKGNGASRRKADVLICARYYEYRRFDSPTDNDIRYGVKFTTNTGQEIVNFPKLHERACVLKHAETNNNFKPTVRIYKNMRNRMIEYGLLKDGIAPSYYIEGMLHNVARGVFTTNRTETFLGSLVWLRTCNRNALLCGHGQRPLLGDGLPDSWPPAHFEQFLQALTAYWTHWR